MRTYLLWITVACLLAAGPVFSAGVARITKDEVPLREQPGDGPGSVVLERGTVVAIEEQQGMWLRVHFEGADGWVRLTEAVRGDLPGQAGGLATLSVVVRGADGAGQVAGVRGLTADDLAAALFNEAELERMEAFALSAEEAVAFAEANALESRDQRAPREGRSLFRRNR